MSARASVIVAVVAGLVLVASSAAHAFLGWPAVRQELVSVGASAGPIQTMAVG